MPWNASHADMPADMRKLCKECLLMAFTSGFVHNFPRASWGTEGM